MVSTSLLFLSVALALLVGVLIGFGVCLVMFAHFAKVVNKDMEKDK